MLCEAQPGDAPHQRRLVASRLLFSFSSFSPSVSSSIFPHFFFCFRLFFFPSCVFVFFFFFPSVLLFICSSVVLLFLFSSFLLFFFILFFSLLLFFCVFFFFFFHFPSFVFFLLLTMWHTMRQSRTTPACILIQCRFFQLLSELPARDTTLIPTHFRWLKSC